MPNLLSAAYADNEGGSPAGAASFAMYMNYDANTIGDTIYFDNLYVGTLRRGIAPGFFA